MPKAASSVAVHSAPVNPQKRISRKRAKELFAKMKRTLARRFRRLA